MDTKYLSLLFIAIAVVVAGCATPAGGRWPQQGAVSPGDAPAKAVIVPANQLALSVAPERSRYQVGEPVYLAITLRNASERAERVIGSLHPEDGAVDVVIAAPDGRQREYVPLGEADHDETIFQSLVPGNPPNEQTVRIHSLAFRPNHLPFTRCFIKPRSSSVSKARLAVVFDKPRSREASSSDRVIFPLLPPL